ncbi:hydroxyacid dehydrogenase [Nesterenkonia xinjiangensis]|uniref:Phosphoglycerate dehydrogenase-like enzyme n=1 Tax=Nesterenkonia xinjiangensis TaxID=225327 RepID=A0A7Z0K7X3_9MICC|nr:hydroxyacid dehydrogenase [Nesterenkonia xinjiangensis]NYJ76969.1 phosphoglycerate dehydrogenase-like enzyme [Nesterenkonia xinjiangensis]
MTTTPTALLAMAPATDEALIGEAGRAEIAEHARLLTDMPLTDFSTPEAEALLGDVEVLITGWGCPPVGEAQLAAAPKLRAIIHTAGSVRGHVGPEVFARGIVVSSAAAANAKPVIEYTLAMILLEGKKVLPRAQAYARTCRQPSLGEIPRGLGNHGTTVGVLSASLIGRGVLERLAWHDMDLLVADPYVEADEAAGWGAELVTNEDLFARSDIVSLHTPLLAATRGLVSAELIAAMKPGATLINTARGAVVDQDALTEAAVAGRIRAVLDVTDPETLPPEHPLWGCENVLITPHLAGSQGNELIRMRRSALADLARAVAGEPLLHPVRHETLELTA